jgi:large subunit ribosomal protein L21
MFAIIQTGGKQYKVKAGDTLLVERLPLTLKEGESLKLEPVLLVSKDSAVQVGKPAVAGAYCEAQFLGEVKGPKSVSFKYIRREKSATKSGHRQKYFKVKIETIHS